MVEIHVKNNYDCTSNINPSTFPDGLDIEIFNFETLQDAHHYAKLEFEREYVTPFIRNNKNLTQYCLRHEEDLSNLRRTADTAYYLIVIKEIINNFKSVNNFSWIEIIDFYRKNKNSFKTKIYLKINYNI